MHAEGFEIRSKTALDQRSFERLGERDGDRRRLTRCSDQHLRLAPVFDRVERDCERNTALCTQLSYLEESSEATQRNRSEKSQREVKVSLGNRPPDTVAL